MHFSGQASWMGLLGAHVAGAAFQLVVGWLAG
jgi:hypothetical protein